MKINLQKQSRAILSLALKGRWVISTTPDPKRELNKLLNVDSVHYNTAAAEISLRCQGNQGMTKFSEGFEHIRVPLPGSVGNFI